MSLAPDAVILKAANLKAGMRVRALYAIADEGFSTLSKDPDSHRGGYVNLRSSGAGWSTPASTLYVVLDPSSSRQSTEPSEERWP